MECWKMTKKMKEEAEALVSVIGREEKKLSPTQLVVFKDIAKGHKKVDKIIVPIVYKDPNELTLSPNNPRKRVDEMALEALTTSIKEIGMIQPIYINTKTQVVVGQRRWLAAKKLNLPRIACIIKRYHSRKEEIMHSAQHNFTFAPLSEEDIAKAIIKLHDKHEQPFDKIARASGISERTAIRYYEQYKEAD